ncbi:predicted protein [Chaetoceros tenuissimus]|uniref:Uncharacterized protein n=1 Tax=Chaetoceros tenuissimus TaxID=426638 RepID=A0AAD3H350_9STRA|nr:predicted protein [Chaetoceros tenuissimus]
MCRPTTVDARSDFRLLKGQVLSSAVYDSDAQTSDESSVDDVSRGFVANLSPMTSAESKQINGSCTGYKRQNGLNLFNVLFWIIIVVLHIMFLSKENYTNQQLSKIQQDILEKSDDLYRIREKRQRKKCYDDSENDGEFHHVLKAFHVPINSELANEIKSIQMNL